MPDNRCSPLEDDRSLDDAVDRRPPPSWQIWLEVAALAALVIAAHWIAGLGTPWLALAPLLAGLRYGSGAGVCCAMAQVAALDLAAHADAAIEAPGGQATLGWLIAGLVPGQFCDAWTRCLRRLQTRARSASQRLDGLARAYHLVVASHDRLQRELPGSPSSLRDAMEALAREVAGSPEARTIEALGGPILALLRTHGAVRAATLHPVGADGRIAQAVAALGIDTARDDDPLLREAVRAGSVVSVRDLVAPANTLVAVPLVDITGRVHAVVAVYELPFLFLHEDTLTLFAILGGRLGDLLARALEASRAVVEGHATRAFCASVRRSLRESRRYGIPAALAIIDLHAPPGETPPRLLAYRLAAHRRITDRAEIVVGEGGALHVVLLLELTAAAGLESYLARVDRLARACAEELGSRCEIGLRGWSLEDSPLARTPRDLELGLAALLNGGDRSSDLPLSRRRHGLVA